jgi:hypothetical protein
LFLAAGKVQKVNKIQHHDNDIGKPAEQAHLVIYAVKLKLGLRRVFYSVFQ